MTEIAREFVLEVGKTLLSLSPLGAWMSTNFGGTIGASLGGALSRGQRRRIRSISREVAGCVRLRATGGERSRGAANSAAYDVLATIRAARVDLGVLVESDLDAGALAVWMRARHKPVGHDGASPERLRNYNDGINEFAARVVAAASELPGFQGAVLSEILKRQTRIKDDLARVSSA